MRKRPSFKADLVVFGLYVFLLASVFSIFVLEKDANARLGLFAASAWILVIIGAIYIRIRRNKGVEDEETQ